MVISNEWEKIGGNEGPELGPPWTTKKKETTKKLEGRQTTEDRGLKDGDWEDREYWRLRCEKRQTP